MNPLLGEIIDLTGPDPAAAPVFIDLTVEEDFPQREAAPALDSLDFSEDDESSQALRIDIDTIINGLLAEFGPSQKRASRETFVDFGERLIRLKWPVRPARFWDTTYMDKTSEVTDLFDALLARVNAGSITPATGMHLMRQWDTQHRPIRIRHVVQ